MPYPNRYPSRREQRERSKIARWKRIRKEGILEKKNSFGVTDLTPWNANAIMEKRQSIQDIKLK